MAKDLICFETWVQWSNVFSSTFSNVGHVSVGGHVGQSCVKFKVYTFIDIHRHIYKLALSFSVMHAIHTGCEQVSDVSFVNTLC
jgi:DNA-binding transcriptional regulator of glucitol operon